MVPFTKLVFTPLSYVGQGALSHLVEEVDRYSPNKIVVISDPTLIGIGILDRVILLLTQSGRQVSVFSEVVPEPPLELAEKLVTFIREEQCDLVIGLGGGSALDLAKLAAVLSVHEGNVADYLNLNGSKKVHMKGLPKLLLPTTSGTGSEVTNIAVLSLENTKDVVAHDYLLADVAIVDPELTLTVPPRVTAATGVDALTHAIEAYLSLNASPTTDALALHSVRLIGKSLRKAVANGQDIEARTNMSESSYMAGLAFFNAGVAGVHALAYPLGGQFHIPHGEANAVLLPYVMKHIQSSCTERLAELSVSFDPSLSPVPNEDAAERFINQLFQLLGDVDLPTRMSDYGIPESALSLLTEDAAKQTRLLARSPMILKNADILAIYKAAFNGT